MNKEEYGKKKIIFRSMVHQYDYQIYKVGIDKFLNSYTENTCSYYAYINNIIRDANEYLNVKF